jgi:formate C-acetyltransferase
VTLDAERARIVTEFYKKNGCITPVILRAAAAYEVCEKKTVRVEDFEIIAGNCAREYAGASFYPEWGDGNLYWVCAAVDSGKWKLGDDGLYRTPPGEEMKLAISKEDVDELREIAGYWTGDKIICAAEKAWQPECYAELYDLDVTNYNKRGVPIGSIPYGHIVPGHDKILTAGYSAIRRQAQAWIDEHKNRLMGEDVTKYMFYRAAVLSADAGSLLCRRYAEECTRKAAAEKDIKRKAELEMMAGGLMHISENPARTYLEACQALMMYLMLMRAEAAIPGVALGRFDMYMWPFLKHDLDEGRLTMDEAQEITDAFFLKASCNLTPGAKEVTVATGVGNTWQHTTIGGCDPDTGAESSNPVTFMVLETIARLRLHDPTVSLRITKDTPAELWELAIETSRVVGGLPLFENDDAIIPALVKSAGFELRDARDHSFVGCQEPVGSGCDYPACGGTHPNHSGIHAGIVLVTALNNGKNPMNGYQSALRTGFLYEMKSIGEVRKAFADMLRYVSDMFMSVQNYSDYIASYYCPHPTVSITMDGCMENGKDVCAGGAKYNANGGAVTGFATVADSFSTIKYMCFDKKICTTRELFDAYMSNWEGREHLRQLILSDVPHFGNADTYADSEFKWCVDTYVDVCKTAYSLRSPRYRPGLIGASDHIAQGYRTWATPDGRKTGTPIADAASPGQGRDINGPTAVMLSSASYDHSGLPNNVALNMKIHSSVLSRPDGAEKLRQLTRTYFDDGGMEIQYNVVDTAILRKAQESPGEYRDLVVRIAGYSAYFVELDLALQNDIISRTEIKL